MKKTNVIILAQSPLQVINAEEACHALEFSNPLFIIFYRRQKDKALLQSVVKLLSIVNVNYIKVGFFSRFYNPTMLKIRLRNYKQADNFIITGTLAGWALTLMDFLQPSKVYIVDDGQQTLSFIKDNQHTRLKKDPRAAGYFKTSTLFTYYKEEADRIGMAALQNNLESLSHRLSVKKSNSFLNNFHGHNVIFIGTNIIEKHCHFEDLIQKVVHHASSQRKKFLYVMHRFEDQNVIARLASQYQFDFIKLEIPIEMAFITLLNDPLLEIWSFGSTAVDTLRLIAPQIPITIFDIHPEFFKSEKDQLAFRMIQHKYKQDFMITFLS